MDCNLIENFGINLLENFLLQTKCIIPCIRKMDKYPIWDGDLLVYNDSNTNKNNLFCRIPVQVKCELLKENIKEIEKYDISIEDLHKYYDDGGVLFIKVIYDDDESSAFFYMKLIMNGDINDIIKVTHHNQKTKVINLYKINKPEEILTICKNYKFHKKYQMQIPENIDLKSLGDSVELLTYSYIDDVKDLVRKEQYVYAKTNFDLLTYVGKMKNDELINTVPIDVMTKNKKYFSNMKIIYTEKDMTIKIGNYVEIKDNKMIICNKIREDLNLVDSINELEFLKDLYINRNIKIGTSEYMDIKFDSSNEIILKRLNMVENNLSYLQAAKETLLLLNMPIKEIKVDEIIKEENNACKLREIICNKKPIDMPNISQKIFISEVNLMGFIVLVYFIKQENGKYIGYDFLNDDIVLNNLVVNDNGKVQLSRYFNLPCNVLIKININEEKMIKELKRTTKNEITVSYINYLMLEFIKAFDFTNNNRYLIISTRINKILRKNRDFYSEIMYLINNYQILKRQGKLSEYNKSSIVNIKIKTEDLIVKCSCCLLLDEYKEFILLFDTLDESAKESYKIWSIYNLLPEKYKSLYKI